MKKFQSQGSALITALLIVTIVAVISTLLALQTGSLIKQTSLVVARDRDYLYLDGVQAWAEDVLLRDLKTPVSFPQSMPAKMYQNVQLTGEISDQLGLFNINSLVNLYNQKQFIRLLKAVIPGINDKRSVAIANAVTDWIYPSNADEFYLRKDPPYRASHQLIVDISELRLINGITPDVYQKILPYVTALPTTSAIVNVNTAPWPVLMTLADGITAEDAQNMVACRQKNGLFNDATLFQLRCGGKTANNWDPGIQLYTSSNYYLMTATAKTAEQQFRLKSLLRRDVISDSQGTHTSIKILWQNRA